MSLPTILKHKNPADFKNTRINIRYSKGNILAFTQGAWVDFATTMKYRSEKCDKEILKKSLNSEGYLLANLGVSINMTMTLNDKNYLITNKHERSDLGDTVVNLIAGYVDARNISDPIKAVEEEITEEFLPVTKEGKILMGLRNMKPLKRPYLETVKYDREAAFQIINGSAYDMRDLTEGEIVLNSKGLFPSPRLYFQVPTNSAQIVYDFHVDIPSFPSKDMTLKHAETSILVPKKATLNHAEDVFVPENDDLEVRVNKEGILLLELENGDLTGDAYTFKSGKLAKYNKRLTLSEAFSRKEKGITDIQSLSMDEYLKEK